ncbi:MAG: hypothetical protein DMD63_04255 [Gemmatimonadetes bacterium]|nr:MAG: hypothetical protein DMD63_04255 [Gemmatimonadota bacterium]
MSAIAGALAIRGRPLEGQSLSPGASEATAGDQPGHVPPFELEEATIADLQSAMASGRRTARSITQLYQ